jgi:AcrR family transcriptional regulator
MPPRLARKPLNSYHHGDLRDTLVQAALQEAERGGPEAISIKALTKKLGVSQPAPYRHFVDREALLQAVTAEAFRQFSATLRESIRKPSKQSKLSRFAQAALAFGLRRNGIYRLMFTSRTMAGAVSGSELRNAAMETFGLLLEAFEAPAIGLFRERQALKIWAALHGMITLAEQGLLTGQLAHISREELLEEIVEQTKSALAAAIKAADAAVSA